MTDAETVAHLREWADGGGNHGRFAWPTDACGYDQHIRFVTHRNENWRGGNQQEFSEFVRKYADMLEKGAGVPVGNVTYEKKFT